MKLMKFGFAMALFAGLAFGESWNGTIMDTMCKGKDAASHTRECAISCAKSGFGLVTADGKFVKFDAAGSDKALVALQKSKKAKDLKATVTGKMQGGVIQVETVTLQ